MTVTAAYAAADARPAGFWIRVMANLVDWFILFAVQFAITLVVGVGLASTGSGEVTQKGMVALVQVLAWVLSVFYVVGFVAVKGQTPGKMALGLRIVREDGGDRVGWAKSVLREIVGKFVSSIILLAGYLMVAFRGDKRGLHDMLAKTRVVKA